MILKLFSKHACVWLSAFVVRQWFIVSTLSLHLAAPIFFFKAAVSDLPHFDLTMLPCPETLSVSHFQETEMFEGA